MTLMPSLVRTDDTLYFACWSLVLFQPKILKNGYMQQSQVELKEADKTKTVF